jgi:hypothetical protein
MHADLRCAVSSAEEIQQTLPGLKDVSLPTIRKWSITSEIEFLALLNLSDVNDLTFRSFDPRNRFFAPIPTQLTELELFRVSFVTESLPGGQRHSLPRLIGLTLVDVAFTGPMSNYFHCPKLRYLEYTITSSRVSSNVTPIQESLNEAFCREASALRSIALEGVTLGGALVRTLASCPILCHLDIESCHLEGFIHPFLERFQDPKYLPYLKEFYIKKILVSSFGLVI